jgi:hypothetical protein
VFEDSTTRTAQQLIAEGEVTPEQAYELEWDVLKRPVFSWEKEAEGNVGVVPGGRTTLVVKCLGKVGWWVV